MVHPQVHRKSGKHPGTTDGNCFSMTQEMWTVGLVRPAPCLWQQCRLSSGMCRCGRRMLCLAGQCLASDAVMCDPFAVKSPYRAPQTVMTKRLTGWVNSKEGHSPAPVEHSTAILESWMASTGPLDTTTGPPNCTVTCTGRGGQAGCVLNSSCDYNCIAHWGAHDAGAQDVLTQIQNTRLSFFKS